MRGGGGRRSGGYRGRGGGGRRQRGSGDRHARSSAGGSGGGSHRGGGGGTGTAAAPEAKFKTKVCIYWLRPAGCPYGDSCLFAHGDHEVRADFTGTTPGDSPTTNSKYKTRLCKHYINSIGTHCPHGVRCTYAHGQTELQIYMAIADGTATPKQLAVAGITAQEAGALAPAAGQGPPAMPPSTTSAAALVKPSGVVVTSPAQAALSTVPVTASPPSYPAPGPPAPTTAPADFKPRPVSAGTTSNSSSTSAGSSPDGAPEPLPTSHLVSHFEPMPGVHASSQPTAMHTPLGGVSSHAFGDLLLPPPGSLDDLRLDAPEYVPAIASHAGIGGVPPGPSVAVGSSRLHGYVDPHGWQQQPHQPRAAPPGLGESWAPPAMAAGPRGPRSHPLPHPTSTAPDGLLGMRFSEASVPPPHSWSSSPGASRLAPHLHGGQPAAQLSSRMAGLSLHRPPLHALHASGEMAYTPTPHASSAPGLISPIVTNPAPRPEEVELSMGSAGRAVQWLYDSRELN